MASTSDAPSTPLSGSGLISRRKSKVFFEGEELSVGHHIDQIGFGAYQAQVFIFVVGSIWCEGAQLATVSGLHEFINSDFRLPEGPVTFVLFIGFALGTIASGSVGDTKGRRLPMLIGYSGITLSQLLLFMAPVRLVLFTAVSLVGFFSGIGIPAAVTALSEVVPSHWRGPCGAAISIGFTLGELWAAVGLRLLVPTLHKGPWHHACLWAIIPPVFFILLSLMLPVSRHDSPQFLANHMRQHELREVLNLIATMNKKPELVLEHDIPSKEPEPDVTFGEACIIMTEGRYGICTFVLSVMFFTFNFGYYGTVEFWPIAWSDMKVKELYQSTELVDTALTGIVGVVVAIITMSKISRRFGACLATVMCLIASACLHGLLEDRLVVGAIGVVIFKLFWMTFQMTSFTLPNEIYPTRVSVWAWSIICFFGRIGCAIAPVVISEQPGTFLNMLCGLLGLSALAVWALPETKDIDLEETDERSKSMTGLAGKIKSPDNYGSIAHVVSRLNNV